MIYKKLDKYDRDFDEERCAKYVTNQNGWGGHQCLREGKLEYKGHLYCKQHYPPNVEAKRKAKADKYAERWAKVDAADERRRLEVEYCSGLTDEELRGDTR